MPSNLKRLSRQSNISKSSANLRKALVDALRRRPATGKQDSRFVYSFIHIFAAASATISIFATGHGNFKLASVTTGSDVVEIGVIAAKNCDQNLCWGNLAIFRLLLIISHSSLLGFVYILLYLCLIGQSTLAYNFTYMACTVLSMAASTFLLIVLGLFFKNIGFQSVSLGVAFSVGPASLQIGLAIYMLCICCRRRKLTDNNDDLVISHRQEKLARQLFDDIELFGIRDDKVVDRIKAAELEGSSPKQLKPTTLIRRSVQAFRSSITRMLPEDASNGHSSASKGPKIFEPEANRSRRNAKRPKLTPHQHVSEQKIGSRPTSKRRASFERRIQKNSADTAPKKVFEPTPYQFEKLLNNRHNPRPAPSGETQRWTAVYDVIEQLQRPSDESIFVQQLQEETNDMIEDLLVKVRDVPPTALRPGAALQNQVYAKLPSRQPSPAPSSSKQRSEKRSSDSKTVSRPHSDQILQIVEEWPETANPSFAIDASSFESTSQTPPQRVPFAHLSAILEPFPPSNPHFATKNASARSSMLKFDIKESSKPLPKALSDTKMVLKSQKRQNPPEPKAALQELEEMIEDNMALMTTFDSLKVSKARHVKRPRIQPPLPSSTSSRASLDQLLIQESTKQKQTTFKNEKGSNKSLPIAPGPLSSEKAIILSPSNGPTSSNRAVFSAIYLPRVPVKAVVSDRQIKSMLASANQDSQRFKSRRPSFQAKKTSKNKGSSSRSSQKAGKAEEDFTLNPELLTAKLDYIAALQGKSEEDAMEELKGYI